MGKLLSILGAPFSAIMFLYNFLSKFGLFWKVVSNASLIEEIWDEGKKLTQMLIDNHGRPTPEMIRLFVDILKKAFKSGLVDFPNVDETQFVQMLDRIEQNMNQGRLILEKVEKKEGE